MSKVYVVHAPTRVDTTTGVRVPTLDFRPAQLYGDLVYMLPGGPLPLDPTRVLIDSLKDFTADDFILPVGNPAAIGVASAIAANMADGNLTMLLWDHGRGEYDPWEAQIWGPDNAESD